jgi:hypothetical protein
MSQTRLLATFFWARYQMVGKPLVLLDFEVAPLDRRSWMRAADRLRTAVRETKSRTPVPLGMFVENHIVAAQVKADAGLDGHVLPDWITANEAWATVCQSCAVSLVRKEVGVTKVAAQRMEQRPFLNEAGVYAGPRMEDPTVPAFLYGVLVGLDQTAAKDPKPRPIARSPR